MGVFRSQTPRAIFVLHNLITTQTCDFIYGRIRPFSLPVSGLLFLWLTADDLRYFLPIRQAKSEFFPLLLSVPLLPVPCSFFVSICPPSHKINHSHFCFLFPAALTSAILLSCLVCYLQGCATPLSLSSRKNYQQKLSNTPRLSRYSFLARSRSSSVGAVFDFPKRSRMTILSNFFSNSFLISFSQLSSSIKWKRSSCINNSCDICTFLIVSHPLRDGMWQLWRLF